MPSPPQCSNCLEIGHTRASCPLEPALVFPRLHPIKFYVGKPALFRFKTYSNIAVPSYTKMRFENRLKDAERRVRDAIQNYSIERACIVSEYEALIVATAAQRAPPHIRLLIERGLVADKVTCPITLEELVVGSIHHTPCGHHLSAAGWASLPRQQQQACAVCRAPIELE